jgi:hypothetical protein
VEQRTLIRGAICAVAATVIALATGGGALFLARATPGRVPRVVAPPGVRVRVEVLNATAIRGLARRATRSLRDRGFDVVQVGTARESLDTTVVLARSGNPAWAELVARALGGARVEVRPDSSRYLDVTVLVGRNWAPPAEPFYP